MRAFIDSGAWIALLVGTDQNHARARELFAGYHGKVAWATSSLVIAESATWLVYHGYRHAALAQRARIEAAEALGQLRVLWPGPPEYGRAWQILEQFEDKRFSFVDCTSFALCETLRPDFVFAFDADFRVVGFELKPA